MYEIKIGESEFRPLLDRQKTLTDLSNAFSAQLRVLRDIVNYGTNLIPRCYGSSDRGLESIVVIGILLRQAVAMLDAVEVLVSNGAVYAAGLQGRSLFEAAAYIHWILLEDAEKKATYYYVHNLRKQRQLATRLVPGSPVAVEFAASMPDPNPFQGANLAEQARRNIENINRVLSQPAFASASNAFDRCSSSKKRKGPPAWYEPLGVRSVSAIFTAVGKSAEYKVFFASWSNAVHSSDYTQHIRVQKDRITFEPIRELSAFATLFRFCVATTLNCYRAILGRYRPGELTTFERKYSESWQTAFMGVPTVKYNVATPKTL